MSLSEWLLLLTGGPIHPRGRRLQLRSRNANGASYLTEPANCPRPEKQTWETKTTQELVVVVVVVQKIVAIIILIYCPLASLVVIFCARFAIATTTAKRFCWRETCPLRDMGRNLLKKRRLSIAPILCGLSSDVIDCFRVCACCANTTRLT